MSASPSAPSPPPRRTLKLELCFDGLAFSGWQVQPSQPNTRTVQGELQAAACRITGESVTILGCGRTDAGVSALRQVATFRTESLLPCEKLLLALNANLPAEIRVLAVSEVPPSFHPIADIARKRYRYLLSDSRPVFPLLKDRVWFTRSRFETEPMRAAAVHLLGTHDFAAFQTTGSPRTSTVRTLYAVDFAHYPIPEIWAPRRAEGLPPLEILSIEVEADGFLYNMVRAIVGTLVLFGQRHGGYEDPKLMEQILESKDRAQAGPTAPAHALYMLDALYGGPNGVPAAGSAD